MYRELIAGLVIVAAAAAAVFYQSKLLDKQYARGYEAAKSEYLQRVVDTQNTKEESHERITQSNANRDAIPADVERLRKQIADLEASARAAAVSRSEAQSADPIGMLAKLSEGLGAEGAELAWYADDTAVRLSNCNREYDALREDNTVEK